MLPDIYIIVPCYNEARVIRKTIEELISPQWQIILVDDGSTEDIFPLVQDLPIHFLRHRINLGQGAALETGMEFARRANAKAVIHFDADGQHEVSEINAFISALNECDIVLGSRFLRQDDLAKIPYFKRLLLRFARIINWFFTGIMLTDAHNGFRALNAKALSSIHLTENRMAHATEILSQIHEAKLKYKELPCSIRYTAYSKSKGQKWYNSFNILMDLIANKLMH